MNTVEKENFMSFIKNIGKNISSKGKELSQKAKVMSETSSLNNIIKGEECKIDFQYKTIGKLYYEKYNENPGEEFAESIEVIKNSIEKIEQTKEEIIKIKAQFNCPNCGTQFKNGALFCSKCGAKLPEKTESESESSQIPADAQKCSNCGNILNKNAIFCNVCGNKLEKSISDEAENSNLSDNTVSEESIAEILTSDRNPKENIKPVDIIPSEAESTFENNQADKPKKICPNCKNEMLDEDIFCNECGTKVE